MTDWNYTPNDVTLNCLYGKTLLPITVIFDRLLLFQMSTNVPINRMTKGLGYRVEEYVSLSA